MPCPKCGSHNLWDDAMNPIWGCSSCGWFGTASNAGHPNDKFNREPGQGVVVKNFQIQSSGSALMEAADWVTRQLDAQAPEDGLIDDGETWRHGYRDRECGEE